MKSLRFNISTWTSRLKSIRVATAVCAVALVAPLVAQQREARPQEQGSYPAHYLVVEAQESGSLRVVHISG